MAQARRSLDGKTGRVIGTGTHSSTGRVNTRTTTDCLAQPCLAVHPVFERATSTWVNWSPAAFFNARQRREDVEHLVLVYSDRLNASRVDVVGRYPNDIVEYAPPAPAFAGA
ncbi:MAG: hypothetical protein VX527_09535 [Planctomycetota bacterium]|nr:hypothetical protein [Planctomycetota bacterium]